MCFINIRLVKRKICLYDTVLNDAGIIQEKVCKYISPELFYIIPGYFV